MEALVAHIQGLSGSPEEVAHLHSLLKQADGDSLRGHAAARVPFLAHLSPETHSLGYLYLLEVCATSGSNLSDFGGGDFLVTVAGFLTSCSADQIRLAPDKFLNVCRVLKDQVMQLNMPIRGIAPLRAAVRKIQSSPEQLTPVHADYLLLCLLAKQYKAGLSVLEDDIFDVDQPKDLFLYCYYGGMIYIGLKKFPKALELLHNAVTAPMSMLNAIAVEAYKKYVLVSLIVNGQVPSFPKYTSVSAQRSMKNHAQDISRCLLWVQSRHRTWPNFQTDPVSKPIDLLMLNKIKESYSQIKVVPPDQACKIYSALKEKCLPVALVEYEGEQHEFRKVVTSEPHCIPIL